MGTNMILDDIINVINDKINTNRNAKITGEILNNVLIDICNYITLTEGVLFSSLSFSKETVDNVEYLVLRGIDGTEIGKIDTADFVVDGMLESVAVKEDNPNILVFTWNADSGREVTEIDFSKYVDVYKADGTTLTLNSASNTFSVKDGVFDTYGSASSVQTDLNNYKTTTNTALTEINDKLYTLNIIIPSGIYNGQNNNSGYATFNINDSDLEKIQNGKVGTVYIRDEKLNTYTYGNISYYTSGGTIGYGGLTVSYAYANKIILYMKSRKNIHMVQQYILENLRYN